MIVPDVNLLLYAHLAAFREHAKAKAWWERTLNGTTAVGVGLPALFGFVRLATNRRVHEPPLSVEAALGHVDAWLERPHVQVLSPGPRHLELAFGLLRRAGAAANLTTDVQLAALALEHRAELHSNDGDFGRFAGLRWVNPLGP
ncbi:MAG TPA: type II toxin-antitoxin system VapC family toxin [Polyangia bacterium]|nr:type II toxin-antitoxin system VapC family toxin [Polyangia bacterium]